MLWMLLLVLAVIQLVAILVNALLLWLTCKIFRVQHESTDGTPAVSVGFGRALLLTLLVMVVNGGLLALTFLSAGFPVYFSLALAALSLLPAILILRFGLPVGFLRAIGVDIVWSIFSSIIAIPVLVCIWLFTFSAFVVPTGAMAESILGYHKQVTCPSCGLTFTVNSSSEVDPGDGRAARVTGCTCPNCRQRIRLVSRFNPGGPPVDVDRLPADSVVDPGFTSGDRVLAAKGLLGARTFPPKRFDVVVFEFPGDPNRPPPTQPIIYVSRLAGLPGEALAIQRGDLFVLDPAELPAPAPGDEPLLDQDDRLPDLFKQGKFRIIRKPPAVALALMRLVHDNDHQAKDLIGKPEFQRWVPADESGWTANTDRTIFSHDGKGENIGWLRYRHVLRDNEGKPSLITDFMGYNTWESANHPRQPDENWASDLILECVVEAGTAGELILELSRGADRFAARFDLAKQSCSLVRVSKDEKQVILKEASVKLSSGTRLRFGHIDERLLLWVNDSLPFGDGVEYDAPRSPVPTKENDLERPGSIGVKGGAVTVKHLRLLRDTYYTAARHKSPSSKDVDFTPTDPDSFRHWEDAPVSAYRVEPGHYFFLGDNSQESSDSRLWGTVRGSKLMGNVTFRYYPFGRWGRVD